MYMCMLHVYNAYPPTPQVRHVEVELLLLNYIPVDTSATLHSTIEQLGDFASILD